MKKIISIISGSTFIKMAVFDELCVQEKRREPLVGFLWEKGKKNVKITKGKGEYQKPVPVCNYIQAFTCGMKVLQNSRCFECSSQIKAVVSRSVSEGTLQKFELIEIKDKAQEDLGKSIDNPTLEMAKLAIKKFRSAKHYIIHNISDSPKLYNGFRKKVNSNPCENVDDELVLAKVVWKEMIKK